ncbi:MULTISPECIES: hypothetical protein [Streptomyces]|uniref:hypothetical protein n=1 Tax=Streptomyces TaxID=1883 RepID=UPI00073DBB87|nr:hypothetical protein [Streptomyces sp. FBKL.4005]MYU28671.1 hypothetical protein [Streptomyces sp. SID7810]OYP17064.1 hypothetical protein CFC35_23255 [Streptomyces sp. FBKL.4005]CUW29711.1 hypothetical protein TUE45_04420 [Streptomyces reticuli]
MSPPTPRELAQTAYAAYGAATGQKNYQGLPMPAWADLPALTQLAWTEAAATIALNVVSDLLGNRDTLMTPDVGDVVLVPADPAANNGAPIAPAVITRVWSPTTVNVRVLTDSSATAEWRTSLLYAEDLATAAPSDAVWTWPGGES